MATSRSLNKVMLIGNLSRNPVVRTTATGATVCTFGIATNTAWRDEGGELQERTEFHNAVAWNKLAEICAQILSVGMLVYIEGELRTRTWEGEDGRRNYRTEIRVSDMKLLDSKGKSGVGIDAAKSAGNENESSVNEEVDGEESKKVADEETKKEDKDEKEKKEEKKEKEEVAPEDLPF